MMTVLLVDPEPGARSLAAFMLRKLGYTVIEARSPAEALEIGSRQGPVDLLLTEAVMYRCNGLQLAESLGGVPAVFMSGSLPSRVVQQIRDNNLRFLKKPFTMADLKTALAPRSPSEKYFGVS